MSHSPERMSSYCRYFGGPLATSSSYQVRISSPSPTCDAVGRHMKEETHLGRIEGLKLEIKVMKEKIALLLREYQELLNIKMALENEITTYRIVKTEDMYDSDKQECTISGAADDTDEDYNVRPIPFRPKP